MRACSRPIAADEASDVLTQTIPTIKGRCYALSYWASQNNDENSAFTITFAGLTEQVPLTAGDSTLNPCARAHIRAEADASEIAMEC